LAAARSDGQGWPQAIAKRLALDGHEHGGRLGGSGRASSSGKRRQFRGELAIGRSTRHNLVFGRSGRIVTMMQSCASAAKLRGDGSNLHSGFEAMVLRRITVTSDRHRQT